ncbi:MAG: T9SS type A sorting domain-containing protein [Salinivirgaceae bacterium]|nr:T9SS type A sorting domain-containing protein [Salinivirgaceae bacterium]MDD4747098.1 T9SS type A sorting domain-containing protein [Salinivirgaceae bacterium]MDY0282315.1 T9SS type A sorting domain-containing protein [Salinivirgaceae bacterium]
MRKVGFFLGIFLSLEIAVQAQQIFSESFTTDSCTDDWVVEENNIDKGTWMFMIPKNLDFKGSSAENGFTIIDSELNSSVNTTDSNSVVEKPIRGAMEGVYSINQDASSDADFHAIAEAIAALNELGIMNTVTFELANDTYDGFIVFEEIFGTTADKRVIFKGKEANADLVILSSNAGYTEKPTVKLQGADFISFENLTITTSSSNFTNLVHIVDGACNNHFTNVKFIGVDVTVSTLNNNKHLVYSPSPDQLDHGSHFVNCRFENGYIALYLTGKNAISPGETDLQVIGCSFINQYSKSIYTNYIEHSLIKQNTFENNNDRKNGFQAIDFFRAGENVIIEQNNIDIQFDTNSATGIELRPAMGTVENPVLVRNNMVRIHSNAGYSYPMNFSNKLTSFVYVSHNTCVMEGTSGGSACVFVEDAIDTLVLTNNILVNNAGGYAFRIMSSALVNLNSDFNLVSVNGTNIAKLGSDDIASLGDWVTAANRDANSRVETINFITGTDLHILNEDNMRVANPLGHVTLDFDDNERSLVLPCAGADEIIGDQAPVVANPVDDVVFTTFPAQIVIDLTQTFDDPDNDNDLMQLSVLSNTNAIDFEVVLNEKMLTISRLTFIEANAVLVIKAISNGLSVNTTIRVSAEKFVAVDFLYTPYELYPNPASSFICFKGENIAGHYDIYNNVGKLVQSGVLNADKIDVNNLRSGLYIFKLKESNKAYRFIKK